MSPPELLAGLRERGVRVALEEGEMKLRGPSHALTPKVLAAARAHKPALRELLLLEAASMGEAQVLGPSSACGEVLRPDIREPLEPFGLAALDEAPPEAPPLPGCQWVRDLGVWHRCGGIVPTDATRAARWRYYAAKAAQPDETKRGGHVDSS